MNIISKTVASTVAAGALILNAGLPIFADTTTISSNGAGSSNFVTNDQTNSTTVTQNNSATVDNTATTTLNTGNNTASFNTGGDVVIATGNAKSSVDVSNALNSNVASLGSCCGSLPSTTSVSGNGALSTNVVNSTSDNSKTLSQNNAANVTNDVTNSLNSGYNDASLNTGGSVTVATGSTASDIALSTRANANEAVLGSPASSSVAGTPASSLILDNGAGSDNFITNSSRNSLSANQNNSANVTNSVAVSSDTGYNKSDFNTGGDVLIHTGSAKSTVGIDNMLNFNSLSTDCGCVTGFSSKISGNGAGIGLYPSGDSFIFGGLGGGNTITNTQDNSRDFSQNGSAALSNSTAFDLGTGYNDNSLSTAGLFGGDPWIVTGNSSSDVMTHNAGNLNVLGGVDVTFDMSPLMGMLHSFHL